MTFAPQRFVHREQHYLLEQYDERDLERVIELENVANPFPWKPEHFRSSLTGGHLCLALYRAGQPDPIGHLVCSLVAGDAELLIIAIHPHHQGKGLASTLLARVLPHLAQHAQHVFLEVRESNDAAIALYESLGFNQVGLRPRYYPASSGRAEDACLYAMDMSCFDTQSTK